MSNTLSKFEAVYTEINEDNLYKAALENPSLVVGIIEDDSLRPFTRAIALLKLSELADDAYWDLCLKGLNHKESLIREAAAQAFVNYAIRDDDPRAEAETVLNHHLTTEDHPGVQTQIKHALIAIDFYKD